MDSNLVQILEVNKITPYARNPRKNDEAVSTVKALIQEFGFLVPILVDKANIIIAGHTRLKAALELGLTHVPVIRAEGLTPEQVKAFRILENKSHERAVWDSELLQLELSEIDIDLDAFDVDFDDLEEPPAEITEDEIPEPKKQAISQIGDLWILGGHRLLCGDSTNGAYVSKLGAKDSVFCLTDPPYSVNYEQSQKLRGGDAIVHGAYHEADLDPTDILSFLQLVPCDIIIFSYSLNRHFFTLARELEKHKWVVQKELIWVKDNFSFWPGAAYQQKHEPFLICTRGKGSFRGNVPANEPTVFEYPKPRAHDLHPTAKPVEMWARLIKNHTADNEIVYEPFSGSGTTISACEQSGRRCFAIEIAPQYVDVAIRRWQTLTSKEAKHENGKTFSEVAKERGISQV